MNELESVFQKILLLAETQAVALSRNPILHELRIADRLAALDKFVTTWKDGGGSESQPFPFGLHKATFRGPA